MEAVPKIEGHAAFYTHLKNGHVDEARIIGLENDRFVEKILVGRKYWEAPIITSRICGICPTIHNVTSTRAIEAACGITPSIQTQNLRKLMLSAQMVQSHSLHLYLLVLPDFVGASSSFELQKNHPEIFKNAIELKRYADRIIETIGGRAVHPVSNVPGGFKNLPKTSALKELLEMSEPIEDIAEYTVRLFAGLKYPKVEREMIYSSLFQENDYAIYDGVIKTTSKVKFKAQDYTKYIQEKLKPYTQAKFGSLNGETMMVGSIARANINKSFHNEKVDALAKDLGIKIPLSNPFDNILAQALENYLFVLESVEMIKKFIKNGTEEEQIIIPNSFGIGTGSCEAPRGTLFHHYELDSEGFITKCDIITPTVQYLTALEADMKNIEPIIKDMKPEERNSTIEMLIRSYDPCITCATH
ncbi:MAG: Ni/Fe hydrogenase subunit alpha [Candidatus Berkelbacteria bacterium]